MNLITEHDPQLGDFVHEVQHRADLNNYHEAHQLSLATLGTLGETISGGEGRQLARWLPLELAKPLATHTGQANRVSPNAFLEKVGSQVTTIDPGRLTGQIRATLQTVRNTAPAGELDDTIAQLPTQIAALFHDEPSASVARQPTSPPTSQHKQDGLP